MFKHSQRIPLLTTFLRKSRPEKTWIIIKKAKKRNVCGVPKRVVPQHLLSSPCSYQLGSWQGNKSEARFGGKEQWLNFKPEDREEGKLVVSQRTILPKLELRGERCASKTLEGMWLSLLLATVHEVCSRHSYKQPHQDTCYSLFGNFLSLWMKSTTPLKVKPGQQNFEKGLLCLF